MENLTNETFVQKIFDYKNSQEWNFKGERPAIIDFYADWCQPCKMVAPILEQLSTEYQGKVDIFKVNTESERELAGAFQITSIPSILFIPKDDPPQMAMGAMPKEGFEEAIKTVLKVEK